MHNSVNALLMCEMDTSCIKPRSCIKVILISASCGVLFQEESSGLFVNIYTYLSILDRLLEIAVCFQLEASLMMTNNWQILNRDCRNLSGNQDIKESEGIEVTGSRRD
jgi:hypothetical protein